MQKTYYPAIDSLRAIAVLFVLFHHYFNPTIADALQLGPFGVDIFFVISGFLITGILLDYKARLTVSESLKKFYFRRILRIFPIYYLYLIVALLFFNVQKEDLLYAALYINNFYVINGGHNEWLLSHFWSLAVEEQFYLIWPLLIFITPQKKILTLIIATFIISVLFAFTIRDIYNQYMNPISCMQAFAFGALIKYLRMRKYYFDLPTIPWIIAGLLVWGIVLFTYNTGNLMVYPLLRICSSFIAMVILIDITSKKKIAFSRVLRPDWLRYIGKISYGIYIYHVAVKIYLTPVMKTIIEKTTSEENIFRYNNYLLTFPLFTLITIGIAALSYRFIEGPIIRLKDRIRAVSIAV